MSYHYKICKHITVEFIQLRNLLQEVKKYSVIKFFFKISEQKVGFDLLLFCFLFFCKKGIPYLWGSIKEGFDGKFSTSFTHLDNLYILFVTGEVKTLLKQLLRAVRHLHDNWILHRDLKTSNLLLSHRGILKVEIFLVSFFF